MLPQFASAETASSNIAKRIECLIQKLLCINVIIIAPRKVSHGWMMNVGVEPMTSAGSVISRCSNLGVLSISVLPFFDRHIRNRLSEYFQKHYKMSLFNAFNICSQQIAMSMLQNYKKSMKIG